MKEFVNKLDLQVEGSGAAILSGKITAVEAEPNRVFAEVEVSEMKMPSVSQEPTTQNSVAPGTKVVIEIRNPGEKYAAGQEITASVRIVKTQGGFKLFAESVQPTK